MERVRLGVVGLQFGRYLIRTIVDLDRAELVAVCDRSPRDLPGGLDGFAAQYGCRAYRDVETMLEIEQLDALILATSPRGRAPLIKMAAERGLALFVEKPWASNLVHAYELAEVCQRWQARVMVGFSFRFHPAIVRLRSLIDNELGPGLLLNGEYLFNMNPPADSWLWDPQNGNGFFNENSCHLFDAICYLLGQPESVVAETINPFGTPSAHAAAAIVHFKSGAVAALTVGGIGGDARLDFPRIDLVTRDGQAHLRGRHHMWDEVHWAKRGQSVLLSETMPAELLGSTRYTHALEHFIDCIQMGNPPSVTIEDGVQAVALAMAVTESAQSGKRVQL